MRIGQILIEAELISPKQLSNGLEYGKSKGIALGKVMKLLKFMDDPDIDRALETQKLIRMGLSPLLAVQALKIAVKEKITVEEALQERLKNAPPAPTHEEIAIPPVDSSLPAEKLIEIGDKLLLDDFCAEAETHYLAALTAIKKSPNAADTDITPLLNRLGNTYMAMSNFEYAKKCYDKLLDIRRQTLSEDHLLIAQGTENLADLYRAEGDASKATETYLMALDILEKHLPSQLSFYASILRKIVSTTAQAAEAQPNKQQPIGELLIAAGLLSEGELQTALRMSKQTQMPLGIVLRENCMVGDRDLQSALKAQFCIKQGVLTQKLAIDLLTRAARRDISLERLLHEAGVLMSEQDKYDTYREIASELDKLVAAETSSVTSQNDIAPIAFKLGSLYDQAGDQNQAEIYYSRALKTWGAEIRGDLNAAKTCTALAKIHRAQNRPGEAAPLLAKALEHLQHALGNNHEETLETMEDLAETDLERKNAKNALSHARTAIAHREELGQTGSKLFRSTVILGDALRILKNYEEAQTSYKKAMTLAQESFGAGSPALAAIIEKLGDLYSEQNLLKTAVIQYKFALVIIQGAGKGTSSSAQSLQEKISKAEELCKTAD